jgi:hypothetical protein
VKMASIRDVRKPSSWPSVRSPRRISAIGEIYGLFPSLLARTGVERIYSSSKE